MKPARLFRRLVLLAAAVLVLSVIWIAPPVIRTAYALSDGNFTYTVTDGKATVTGYTGAGGDVNIPFLLGGYPVTEIGGGAFSNSNTISSVTIPEGVETIDMQAFAYSQYITRITIPNSVTSIGDDAFLACYYLHKIAIPSSVKSIGENVFDACYWLSEIKVDAGNPSYSSENGILFNKKKTVLIHYPSRIESSSYIIPGSVTTIDRRAFRDAAFLNSITIPNSVREIKDCAFMGCSGLQKITLPASVTTIGDDAFSDCYQLEAISVSSSNPSYSSLDGVLFNKARTVLMKYPSNNGRIAYTVPDGVTRLLNDAFAFSYNLETINIPASVTDFSDTHENNVFWLTIRLKEVNVDSRNTAYLSIDGVLFDKSMKTLVAYPMANPRTTYTIPEGITEIGRAFEDNGYLKSVKIPSSVSAIRGYGFWRCKRLSEVIISDGVTSIESCAFAECPALTSMIIPESVMDIGYGAFSECDSLSAAYFRGNAPVLGDKVFDESGAGFTVYYPVGASGYSDPWFGYHTKKYDPKAKLLAPALSIDRTSGLLKGVPLGLPIGRIKSLLLNSVDDIRLLDKNGSEYTGGTVATGMSVQLNVDGATKDMLKVCVAGDVSGDGKISVADYTLVRLHLLRLKSQTGAYLAASDVNRDGRVSISDYTDIRLDILNN